MNNSRLPELKGSNQGVLFVYVCVSVCAQEAKRGVCFLNVAQLTDCFPAVCFLHSWVWCRYKLAWYLSRLMWYCCTLKKVLVSI